VFLLIYLGLMVDGETFVPVELIDMSTWLIVSANTAHETTVISSSTNFRSTDHFFFDHQSRSVFQLKDGRLPKMIAARIMDLSSGFAIVEKFDMTAYSYSLDGAFLGIERLLEYEGAPKGFTKTHQIVSSGPEQALVSFVEQENASLGLARIDFSERTFDVLYMTPLTREDESSYWVSLANELFFVSETKRCIDLISRPSYTVTDNIVPERDLVANPRWPRSSYQFQTLMANPVFLSDRALWEVFTYDKQGKVADRPLYQLRDKTFQELNPRVFPVGTAAGVTLVFDMDDGSYFLEDATTGARIDSD